MQKHALTLATALLGVGILTACGGSKSTQPSNITYNAILSGANENPATTSTGTGTWTGILNPNTNIMSYTLQFSGLTTNSTASHIHAQAITTANANVVLDFASFAGATTPLVTGQTSGSAAGSVNMSGGTVTGFSISGDSLRKAMDAGMAYVNVHSTQFKGGEIRGQIQRKP